jgi:NAD(P)-dependent dehydrogenase (short-subunit alcohol dehydrogenase family)/acyl dehydratase
MSESLRYDGKVVVITGAGNGLGRSHALDFGARGAKVVVNDLGGSTSGGGKSSAAADKVVEEIRALGGQAVANYDSVEDGDKIVQTALDSFGTVDVVINNAGILRDVSFQKMSLDDWKLILNVHLHGSFRVTHAAWPVMRDKGYGRVIFTTSAAGIYGNFGQANYSAAKLGLYGLANTLAIEGRNKGIHVNTIAPIAASRLTESVLPPELMSAIKPEFVTPLVSWLCHESCRETGGLFEVGASYFSKLRWERTRGHMFGVDRAVDAEAVAAKWGKIADFDDAEHPATVNDTFGAITEAANRKSLGGNQFIDLDAAFAASETISTEHDERALALYALGVGAGANPVDTSDLPFVYEGNEQFAPLPSYAVMPPSNALVARMMEGASVLPGLAYGFDRVLHGEQYTEIRGPFPKSGKLAHTFKLKAAYDKKPPAVTVLAISSRDAQGNEVAYNEFTTFVRGAGGWGGERGPSGEINLPPAREPDAVVEEKTRADQALLYRLSGDTNPLHADPAFAKVFGYDQPILHGLCTYGYVTRHLLKAMAGNDPRLFKSIKVRFAETVFPGETLVTKMWKESGGRVIFETSVKERGKVVIRNAAAEIHAQAPQYQASAKAAPAAEEAGISPADVFSVIAAHIAGHPDLVAATATSFQFHLKNPASAWYIDLKNGKGGAGDGTLDGADVSIDLDRALLHQVMTSSIPDIQKLYFGGKIKIGGNLAASNKLAAILTIDPALYEAARQRRAGATAKV